MREAKIERNTKETMIKLSLNLDGSGKCDSKSGVGFFDHMMVLFAKHSGFDLALEAKGDLEVDTHHTIEDIGIVLGEAFKKALGDKMGINRYGTFFLPMDETLALVSLDLSGRSALKYFIPFTREKVGDLETETILDFFKAFTDKGEITLHIKMIEEGNNHHMVEAVFKGLARALKEAVKITGKDLPSSKGLL